MFIYLIPIWNIANIGRYAKFNSKLLDIKKLLIESVPGSVIMNLVPTKASQFTKLKKIVHF